MLLTTCPGKSAFAFPESGSAGHGTSKTSQRVPLPSIEEGEVGHIFGSITASAIQLETLWLLTRASKSMGMLTEGKIAMVEFHESGTAPRRNSTIGHFPLSDTMYIIISASSLATYGDKGFREMRFVFFPNMNTRINARNKIVHPNTLQPASLNLGRRKKVSISLSETDKPHMREGSLELKEGLAKVGSWLGSTVHAPVSTSHKFIEDKKFNPAGTLLRHVRVPGLAT